MVKPVNDVDIAVTCCVTALLDTRGMVRVDLSLVQAHDTTRISLTEVDAVWLMTAVEHALEVARQAQRARLSRVSAA